MIQYLKDFFRQTIPCDDRCDSPSEELRIAKRDLLARNEQIESLLDHISDLEQRQINYSTTHQEQEGTIALLEQEIEALRYVLGPKRTTPRFTIRQKKQHNVAQGSQYAQNNNEKPSQ